MDEVSFGPRREIHLPLRYRRALAAAAAGVVSAGVVAAGVVLAVTATGTQHADGRPHSDSAPAAAAPHQAGCQPDQQPTWPDLAALPASERPGALEVIIQSEFSGQCPARPAAGMQPAR